MVINREKARHRFREWLRHFNKRITNPITMIFAGRRVYGVVHHVGRRSGKSYKAPVLAAPVEGGFVIPLPYGDHVDWYRNIVAAGGGRLLWRGQLYTITAPHIVNASEALPAYASWVQKLLCRNEVEQFLKVKTRPFA
jgi:deazaflavin-dependent oxidoreductase (nitroreductase family)